MKMWFMIPCHRRAMLEEGTLRKMKGLLATSNRLPPWSSVVNQYSQEQVKSETITKNKNSGALHFYLDFDFSKPEVAELTALTVTFLNFMSGGEPVRLLEVILQLIILGSVGPRPSFIGRCV